jgi:hypothetical protein
MSARASPHRIERLVHLGKPHWDRLLSAVPLDLVEVGLVQGRVHELRSIHSEGGATSVGIRALADDQIEGSQGRRKASVCAAHLVLDGHTNGSISGRIATVHDELDRDL